MLKKILYSLIIIVGLIILYNNLMPKPKPDIAGRELTFLRDGAKKFKEIGASKIIIYGPYKKGKHYSLNKNNISTIPDQFKKEITSSGLTISHYIACPDQILGFSQILDLVKEKDASVKAIFFTAKFEIKSKEDTEDFNMFFEQGGKIFIKEIKDMINLGDPKLHQLLIEQTRKNNFAGYSEKMLPNDYPWYKIDRYSVKDYISEVFHLFSSNNIKEFQTYLSKKETRRELLPASP